MLLTLAIAMMVGALWQVDRRMAAAMAVYAAAFALAATDTASQAAAQAGLGQLDARPLLWLAEVLAVGAAAGIYWALRPRRTVIAVRWGVAAGGVLLLMLIGGASTTRSCSCGTKG